MSNYKETVEQQAERVNKFIDSMITDTVTENKEDSKKANNVKVQAKKSIDQLKNSLISCKSEQDFDKIISGLQNILKKAGNDNVNEDEKNSISIITPEIQKVLDSLQNEVNLLSETVKKQGETIEKQKADIKKLRGSIWKKLGKSIMKWGAIVILIGCGASYLFDKIPEVVKDAVKAEVTAVTDDVKIIKDAVNGNTKTINNIIDQQNQTSLALAQKIEKNHKEFTERIDGIIASISKLANFFKTDEEKKADFEAKTKELQELIKQWKDLDNGKPSKSAETFQQLCQKTNDTVSGMEDKKGVDDSVKKLLTSIKIGIKDTAARFTNPKTNESIYSGEFRRQKQLLEVLTSSYDKKMLSESFGKSEALVHKAIYDVWKDTQRNINNPEDAKVWYFKHKQDIIKLMNDKSVSSQAKNSLKKAFDILSVAIEGHTSDKSFIAKHWLKIIVLICYITLFLVAGFAGIGAATATAGTPLALSNTEALMTFLGSGWAFVWRVFLGMLTGMGILKFIKWKFLK